MRRMIFSGVAATLVLTACGGGGGDPAPAPAAPGALDKYAGTYVRACRTSPYMVDAPSKRPLYQKDTAKFIVADTFEGSPLSQNAVVVEQTIEVFDTSDCSKSPRKTMTGSNYSELEWRQPQWTVDGKTVDVVTFGLANFRLPERKLLDPQVVDGILFLGGDFLEATFIITDLNDAYISRSFSGGYHMDTILLLEGTNLWFGDTSINEVSHNNMFPTTFFKDPWKKQS